MRKGVVRCVALLGVLGACGSPPACPIEDDDDDAWSPPPAAPDSGSPLLQPGVPLPGARHCPSHLAQPPLLRAGCLEAPAVGDCSEEGLVCLYESTAPEGCYERWECLLGLWSPRSEACSSEMPPAADNSASCPASDPVTGTPCTPERLTCRYGLCWEGASYEATFSCDCGRWGEPSGGCPVL